VDLGDTQLYSPEAAAERVATHADHFVDLIRRTLAEAAADGGTVVVSPYDAELFGHWWFEGPAWLEGVARRMAANGVRPVTLAEVVDRGVPAEVTTLQEGSWGEGGDHRVWLNRETEWTWDRVYDAEQGLMAELGKTPSNGQAALRRRLLTQACREALLLQASDWQFLITTGSARDYSERRFAEHYAEFKRLLELAAKLDASGALSPEEEESLRRVERDDFPFPDLDPSWALGAPGA
jgi:1,4-alpha-glucan branching enzyme